MTLFKYSILLASSFILLNCTDKEPTSFDPVDTGDAIAKELKEEATPKSSVSESASTDSKSTDSKSSTTESSDKEVSTDSKSSDSKSSVANAASSTGTSSTPASSVAASSTPASSSLAPSSSSAPLSCDNAEEYKAGCPEVIWDGSTQYGQCSNNQIFKHSNALWKNNCWQDGKIAPGGSENCNGGTTAQWTKQSDCTATP